MKLVINADDFGLSRGVNYGIIDAHQLGVLTSTTLMVTMDACDHAVELSTMHPNLGIGLHLNITLGKPITKAKSLIKSNGEFYKPKEEPDESLFDEEEIYNEFKAQYQLFVEKLNRKPTHLDSHLYAHQVYEKAGNAIKRLAIEYDLPVRDMKINGYDVKFFDWFKLKQNKIDNLTEFLESNIKKMQQYPVCELMVHPAYLDYFISTKSSYNNLRYYELDILTSDILKNIIINNKIELIHYGHTK
ncbi:chitin disaccharide deacetylase [Acholeplasma granularum]|uniref:chitin disaccharide deacetylase n=1 Tax=Acholeplasma granularum TaxID=264635 RepID=UPI0004B72DB6|nr:chitin disaccharide deacetylase [Acholeplasma granularum]